MTNKLVVIINSLKVPKIKKIILYEMKFLVPNYSCLHNPWVGATAPRSPFSLPCVLNWICWTPTPNKIIPDYATAAPRPLYPREKTWYPLYLRLGGPQGRSRWVRKISPAPGFGPRTVQAVVSRWYGKLINRQHETIKGRSSIWTSSNCACVWGGRGRHMSLHSIL